MTIHADRSTIQRAQASRPDLKHIGGASVWAAGIREGGVETVTIFPDGANQPPAS